MRDALIIGAGPAGLNAALILGRCRRDVLALDSGKPRNAAAKLLHGYLGRDGTPPMELRAIGRREMAAYPSVQVRDGIVVGAERVPEGGFDVVLATGEHERARALLLATGREDLLPDIRGFEDFYGNGIYHCPYCDGWENRDARIAVLGGDEHAASLALTLRTWTDRLTICPDGKPAWSTAADEQLAASAIQIVPHRIVAAEGEGRLQRVLFDGWAPLACDALFFCSECRQRSKLPETLGCRLDADGNVLCKGYGATDVPGLFVAGNVRGGVHLAIMAAAEGAEAAIAINDYLADLELARRAPPSPAR